MNSPKYKIGDRLEKTNVYVRGVMTRSNGKHVYFLQINEDDSVTLDEDHIQMTINAFQIKDE